MSISSEISKAFEKNYLNASNKVCSPERIPKSTSAKITAAKAAITKTMTVVKSTSRRVGQTTLDTSERTCWINCNGLLIAMDRPFKLVLLIMRFAVTFNPWSHQVARSYLPRRVYLFIAETAMLNTFPQKSLERRIFQTDRFANTHKKTPTRPFYSGHPRAFSRPMKLSNNITFKATRLYSRPIAVQRSYFAPSAGT